MAKADSIQRLILVAHRINARPYITIEELEEWLEVELARNGYANACSPNTIKRDIQSLRNDFAINIRFSRAENGYFIDKSDHGYNPSLSLVETFDTLAVMGAKGSTPSFMHLEPFQPKGTQHLHAIIEAIELRKTIEFSYYKYSNSNGGTTLRTISPYAIKQMQGRWYVIGKEHGKAVRIFGLDRIEALGLSESEFQQTPDFSMEEHFANSFGIYSGDTFPVEEVLLSFDSEDAGYLKSVPLHSSQEIVTESETEFVIKLHIRVTFDFIMELLSRSNSLKVIAPASLRTRLCEIYRSALLRNKTE